MFEDRRMNPREREAAMLNRCMSVARSVDHATIALNGREANVFRVASMVIQSRFPIESKMLMDCASRYFSLHPDELGPAADVVRKGDVISLPRLRDSLTRRLNADGDTME